MRKQQYHHRKAGRRRWISEEYAAGFIDGDGSIWISNQSGGRQHVPMISATCSERAVVLAFSQLFGGRVYEATDPRSEIWKKMYIWRKVESKWGGIIPRIQRHLIIKRKQASLCQRLNRTKKLKNHAGLSESLVVKRKNISDSVRVLNGNVGCPHTGITSERYLAGFFDAEGSVCIERQGKSHRVAVYLNNRCRCVLDRCQKIFGGYVSKGHGVWRWCATSLKAHAFLVAVEPFLVVKSGQALEAIHFRKLLGVKLPRMEMRREAFRKRVMLLNARVGVCHRGT